MFLDHLQECGPVPWDEHRDTSSHSNIEGSVTEKHESELLQKAVWRWRPPQYDFRLTETLQGRLHFARKETEILRIQAAFLTTFPRQVLETGETPLSLNPQD